MTTSLLSPTLRWNNAYVAKRWIKHNHKVWLIEPEGNRYQRIEKLS